MGNMSETDRLTLLTLHDKEFWQQEGCVLAGMDEVGRGPLAGPVVVACAVMPPEPLLAYVNDSKKLSEKRREELYPQLSRLARAYATAWVDPETIDRINILQATRLAFSKAFEKVNAQLFVTDVLIDALRDLEINARQHPLIHGDALSYSIAAASILAKVERDRYMIEQDATYPVYGFAANKGYGTAAHIAAIREYGPCPLHRLTFIKKFL